MEQTMKRVIKLLLLWTAGALACAGQVTYTVPQSVVSKNFFNAVTAATTSPCFTDIGQVFHQVVYTGTVIGVQIQIEASFNSDAATCTTGTWFPISDQGIDPQTGANIIVGIGSYPYVRANLVTCGSCGTGLTASYTGTSSLSGFPLGSYGAGQQIRKIVFNNLSTDSNQTSSPLYTPYGSMAGSIVVAPTGNFPAAATLLVDCLDTGVSGVVSQALPTGAPTSLTIPSPATPCVSLRVRYTQGGSTVQTFSAFYFFYPPGAAMPASAQPASTKNSETTAVNATASVTLTPSAPLQRAHVFFASARCSAGTAQLLVVDTTTSTNLWTSAAGEVGATTFRSPQWNPALAGAPRDTLQVQLTTCGAANTGTLDVQGSVF